MDGTVYAKPSTLPSPEPLSQRPRGVPSSYGFYPLRPQTFLHFLGMCCWGGKEEIRCPELSSVTLTIHFPGLWVGGGRLPGMLLTGPDPGFGRCPFPRNRAAATRTPVLLLTGLRSQMQDFLSH